ncbi:MAG: type II toxin-antitoxin system VapC family toxin [Opitutales bacterium]
MSGWLLDTNVLSELRKPRCAEAVRNWVDARDARRLYISSVTFAEIRFGIDQLRDASRRHALNEWLETELRPWFGERVIEIDEAVILRWRELVEAGRTYSQPDLFLAAAAGVHNHCLATRNTADFQGTGVALVNPWKGAA